MKAGVRVAVVGDTACDCLAMPPFLFAFPTPFFIPLYLEEGVEVGVRVAHAAQPLLALEAVVGRGVVHVDLRWVEEE